MSISSLMKVVGPSISQDSSLPCTMGGGRERARVGSRELEHWEECIYLYLDYLVSECCNSRLAIE